MTVTATGCSGASRSNETSLTGLRRLSPQRVASPGRGAGPRAIGLQAPAVRASPRIRNLTWSFIRGLPLQGERAPARALTVRLRKTLLLQAWLAAARTGDSGSGSGAARPSVGALARDGILCRVPGGDGTDSLGQRADVGGQLASPRTVGGRRGPRRAKLAVGPQQRRLGLIDCLA